MAIIAAGNFLGRVLEVIVLIWLWRRSHEGFLGFCMQEVGYLWMLLDNVLWQ